jgi:hypothetical protein
LLVSLPRKRTPAQHMSCMNIGKYIYIYINTIPFTACWYPSQEDSSSTHVSREHVLTASKWVGNTRRKKTIDINPSGTNIDQQYIFRIFFLSFICCLPLISSKNKWILASIN